MGTYGVSADGRFVVFQEDLGSGLELYRVASDGSGPRTGLGVVHLNGRTKSFQLTGDGTLLVFQQNMPDSSSRLYVVPGQGGTPLQVSGSEGITKAAEKEFLLDPSGRRAVYRSSNESELYSVLLDGSAGPLRLDPPGLVRRIEPNFALSPDGTRVVFLTERETSGSIDLYSAPIDGAAPAVKLNLTRPGGDVTSFQVAFDSLGVAYRADQDEEDVFELYVSRIDGGGLPQQRSAPLANGEDVLDFAFAQRSDRLVYRAGVAFTSMQLFSVGAIAGGAPVPLSDRSVFPVVHEFALDPSGLRVVFRAHDVAGTLGVHAVPSDGSDAPRAFGVSTPFRILGDSGFVLFASESSLAGAPLEGSGAVVTYQSVVAPDGELGNAVQSLGDGTLAFLARTNDASQMALYRAPLDGSAPATNLGTLLRSGESLTVPVFTADGGRLVFQRGDELASVSTRGGRPALLSLGSTGETLGDVGEFWLSPDGQEVVYSAAEGGAKTPDLYSVASDGSRASIVLHPPHRAFVPLQPAFSPDGSWLAYLLGGQLFSARPGERLSARRIGSDVASSMPGAFQILPDSRTVLYEGSVGGGVRLMRTVLDGSAPAEQLELGSVLPGSFVVSPDGTWIAYRSAFTPGLLMAAPLDGSSAPVVQGQAVEGRDFEFTPDSTRLLFVKAGDQGLYVTRREAGFPTRLSDASAGPVLSFRSHPSGARVLVLQTSGSEAVLVSASLVGDPAPLILAAAVEAFELEPNGARVAYTTITGTGTELGVLPIDGSEPAKVLYAGPKVPLCLNGGPFRIVDGSIVFFTQAAGSIQGARALCSVPLDGSAPARTLVQAASEVLVRWLAVVGESEVAFLGELPVPGSRELFLVPVDGSRMPRALNAPLVAGGDVSNASPRSFQVTPDGRRVLYLADQDENETVELFAASIGAHRARPASR
ncbi:MAG: hypothetical protein ABL998_02195 [Planctomycetota bacterium]